MCHRLLAKALELEHPGIDPEGIETMKGFIAAGRFPHSHYIKMWSKRLEEMGVVSSQSKKLFVMHGPVLNNIVVFAEDWRLGRPCGCCSGSGSGSGCGCGCGCGSGVGALG